MSLRFHGCIASSHAHGASCPLSRPPRASQACSRIETPPASSSTRWRGECRAQIEGAGRRPRRAPAHGRVERGGDGRVRDVARAGLHRRRRPRPAQRERGGLDLTVEEVRPWVRLVPQHRPATSISHGYIGECACYGLLSQQAASLTTSLQMQLLLYQSRARSGRTERAAGRGHWPPMRLAS